MKAQTIHHVSDTAIWIAQFRAQESGRNDAAFRDPLAATLAGERGKEIVDSMPHQKAMEFAMVIRTTAIDRLIENAISNGIDTVINLGAGLDTRPYRMDLPEHLHWIEVDFPHLINYKTEKLSKEKSVCRLTRIPSDLSEDEARKKLFAQLGAETRKALIITEGVIGYLTNEQAEKLSRDLFSIPSFQYWIQDYARGKLRKNRQSNNVNKKLTSSPLLFDVADPLNFFSRHGWKIKENIFILDEADRIGKKMPVMFPWSILMKIFPSIIRNIGNKTFGYVMFARQ